MKWPETARWTEHDVGERGYRNREQMDFSIARAMSYLLDNEKKKRIGALLCKTCFYSGGRMAGQAFTEWNCRVCLKDQPDWPNTGTPLACEKCAREHNICKECGADLWLRVRRSNCKLIDSKGGCKSE